MKFSKWMYKDRMEMFLIALLKTIFFKSKVKKIILKFHYTVRTGIIRISPQNLTLAVLSAEREEYKLDSLQRAL